ncbi:hypothetical protein NBRC116592_03980 [Colwellia sp. KU-HH00111]|uniref:hypothetical protein n=1 Tax=Colwellia sp. KU-HH00111 TaxID=3127652 RepID=UPI0031028E24
MITVDLRIKNTDLTITSVEDLIKFEQSESKLGVEGIITHDEIKHHAYSLAEVMLIISSLNIGDLSELAFIEVDLENSSEEIQEIILDSVAEIESLESRSEVKVGSHEFYKNHINDSVYHIHLLKNDLVISNQKMYDLFFFKKELQYKDKHFKVIELTDSQINGVKSQFTKGLFDKYDASVSEVTQSIDLENCHESIKNIAIGLVRSINGYRSKAEVNIMDNNHSVLEVKGNKYSIFTLNNTLFAHKEGSSFKDILYNDVTAKVNLSEDQMSKCIAVDFEDEVDPYVVQLDEEREEALNS